MALLHGELAKAQQERRKAHNALVDLRGNVGHHLPNRLAVLPEQELAEGAIYIITCIVSSAIDCMLHGDGDAEYLLPRQSLPRSHGMLMFIRCVHAQVRVYCRIRPSDAESALQLLPDQSTLQVRPGIRIIAMLTVQ